LLDRLTNKLEYFLVDHLNTPHGGTLVDLLVDDERRAELKEASLEWPSWDLTPRQICDLELLMNGGFSPLTGFLGQADFESVCEKMRLADGTLWPLPITLDVTEEVAEKLEKGKPLALRDPEGTMLAVLTVDDMWKLDRETKAQAVYGTLDRKHPGVAHLFERTNNVAVGGRIEGIELPPHYDFVRFRLTPEQTRRRFSRLGWRKIVAFQTRNPMHRAHYELTLRAARDLQANLLIHPVVGMTKPGDVDHYTRVRCYQALAERYPRNTALMALLPLAMRMGGPREAVLHAIIRKNYGCSHFIVGRDHAGPGVDSNGQAFYDPYEAQESRWSPSRWWSMSKTKTPTSRSTRSPRTPGRSISRAPSCASGWAKAASCPSGLRFPRWPTSSVAPTHRDTSRALRSFSPVSRDRASRR
jgi:sulfate adenylyltransferase